MHVRTLRHDRTVFRTSATAENSALLLEGDLRINCGRVFVSMLFLLLVPAFMRSQTPMIEHPLQELTAQEYWTTHELLQPTGRVDPDTAVMSVLHSL